MLTRQIYNKFLDLGKQVNYFGGWGQGAKSFWHQGFADGQTYIANIDENCGD